MATIEVYTTKTCPYCARAKHLLDQKGVVYEEIRVDIDEKRRAEMMERSKRRTVPQIFINGESIGGIDIAELVTLGISSVGGYADALLQREYPHQSLPKKLGETTFALSLTALTGHTIGYLAGMVGNAITYSAGMIGGNIQ